MPIPGRRRLTTSIAQLITRQSSIARLERGTTPPSLPFLSKVAAALGARVDVHLSPIDDAFSRQA